MTATIKNSNAQYNMTISLLARSCRRCLASTVPGWPARPHDAHASR
jgi:hypothetical protein